MKPSWDDAPSWANWLAMDDDGLWWWYCKEPKVSGNYFFASGLTEEANPNHEGWKSTLEARP